MPLRRLVILVLALAITPALQADAGNASRQAQLRISLTIIDSCDIVLAADDARPSRDARVECSGFMPHQLAWHETRPHPPASARHPTIAPALPLEPMGMATLPVAPPPHYARQDVTVATVVF